VKYFNGPLALFNSHGFAREDVFSLERGVRGDYAGGESLFIFAYEDPERAEAAFKRAEEFFAAAPDHEVTRSPEGERFHMQDSKGGFFRLERIEGFVLIAGGPEPSGDAAPLLVEARTRVTGR
jgi:hypothetical protein